MLTLPYHSTRTCCVNEILTDYYRIRYQVMQASAVNYGADALKLAEMIKAYNID